LLGQSISSGRMASSSQRVDFYEAVEVALIRLGRDPAAKQPCASRSKEGQQMSNRARCAASRARKRDRLHDNVAALVELLAGAYKSHDQLAYAVFQELRQSQRDFTTVRQKTLPAVPWPPEPYVARQTGGGSDNDDACADVNSVAYGIPRQERQGLPAPALRTRYNALYSERHNKNGRWKATPDGRRRSAPVVPLPTLPVVNQPAGPSALATPTGGAPAAIAAVNTPVDTAPVVPLPTLPVVNQPAGPSALATPTGGAPAAIAAVNTPVDTAPVVPLPTLPVVNQPAGPSALATPTGGAPAAIAAVNTPVDTAPMWAAALYAQVPVATNDAVAPATGTAHAPMTLVSAAAAALSAAARGTPARPPTAPPLSTPATSGAPVETMYSTALGGVVGTTNTAAGVRASQGPGPAFMEGGPAPVNLACVRTIHEWVANATERQLVAENAAAMAKLATRETVLREAGNRKLDEACVSTEEEDVTGGSGESADESDGDS